MYNLLLNSKQSYDLWFKREKTRKKKKKKDRIRIIVGFRMSSNEAKLRRSLREKSYEASSREMLSHMAEEGTVPRRIPREYECSMGWGNRGTSQGSAHVGQPCHAPHAAARRWNEQQQFCRSASARLPRTRHPATLDPDDDDYERSSEQDSRDGERKIQQVGYIHRATMFSRVFYTFVSRRVSFRVFLIFDPRLWLVETCIHTLWV